jgi:membrane protein YqaA with SNARE-associated domain
MGGFGWSELVALLTSVGFGVISAIFPVINAEAYVVLSQVSAAAGAVPIAIGIAVGQTVGKVLLFLGVRRGKDFPFIRHRADRPRRAPGPRGARIRARFRAAINWSLGLVGHPRWGPVIVFVAALVGLPPLFAVALLAGATPMKLGWFIPAVFVGRVGRFVLLALGGTQIQPWFI